MAIDKSKRATYINFIGIERSAADSAAFIALPAQARALYLDLRRQFNGKNNGDICAADSVLSPYGWAHSSIAKNLLLLVKHGLIVKTRKGGIGAMSRTPTLYGFTDLPIMANPSKGISGELPSLAYRDFKPEAKVEPKSPRTKKQIGSPHGDYYGTPDGPLKVHHVTPPPSKVHAVYFRFPTENAESRCASTLSRRLRHFCPHVAESTRGGHPYNLAIQGESANSKPMVTEHGRAG
jgi:hypothetical protein